MDESQMLDYLDYALSVLENEIAIYKVALRICDFETAKNQVWYIEEKSNYVEMNARAYRDKLNEIEQ